MISRDRAPPRRAAAPAARAGRGGPAVVARRASRARSRSGRAGSPSRLGPRRRRGPVSAARRRSASRSPRRWRGPPAEKLPREALLRRVQNLEAREIRVPTGNQDYLAAFHGGLAAYHATPDGTVREAIARSRRARGAPGARLLRRAARLRVQQLGHVPALHRRRGAHRHPDERDRRDRARDARRATGRRPRRGGTAHRRGGPAALRARSLGRHPGLRRAGAAARRAGAIGVKVCGAGGGGCLVAFAGEGRARSVAVALEGAGARVLACRIARRGVAVSGS